MSEQFGITNYDALSPSQKRAAESHNKLGYDKCIRFYDKNGNHKLSMVRCTDCGIDFVKPDGEVVWCCADNHELIDVFECLGIIDAEPTVKNDNS